MYLNPVHLIVMQAAVRSKYGDSVQRIHIRRAFQPIWPAEAPTEYDVDVLCLSAPIQIACLRIGNTIEIYPAA